MTTKHVSWQAQHIVDLKVEKMISLHRFCESDAFAPQLLWGLQFQSRVLEVLSRAIPLRFVMQGVCAEVRFC